MAKSNVNHWVVDKNSLAMCFVPGAFKSVFYRSWMVPQETVALVESGEEMRLYREGEVVEEFDRVLLVKTEEVLLEFELEDLLSEDDYEFGVEVSFFVKVWPQEANLCLLRENLLEGEELLTVEGLRDFLSKGVQEALHRFTVGYTAADLYKRDLKLELGDFLKSRLSELLFDSGFEFVRVHFLEFRSPAYERVLEREREFKEEERLHQMRKRLELEEANAKKEAEELKRILAYEGVLKELELKAQLSQKKQEEQLRRYEELCERLGKDEVKALIFLLEDEKMKAELIQSLIEKDMTKEQIEARKQLQFQRQMEEKLAEFTRQLDTLMKTGVAVSRQGGVGTKRIFLTCGQKVYSFDPHHRLVESSREVYDFEGRGLG
ncbi:MAG: hypothetical protein D6805_03235, partial [Planctomycetota bacterium]